ncbi:hypothetical protein GJ496_011305 [Pomphorhynchus laevis]|nr:hypothetical protein GJ496_011305 [Pomphorhynchus laevis]
MLDICGVARNNFELYHAIGETQHSVRFIKDLKSVDTALIDHYAVKYHSKDALSTQQNTGLPSSLSVSKSLSTAATNPTSLCNSDQTPNVKRKKQKQEDRRQRENEKHEEQKPSQPRVLEQYVFVLDDFQIPPSTSANTLDCSIDRTWSVIGVSSVNCSAADTAQVTSIPMTDECKANSENKDITEELFLKRLMSKPHICVISSRLVIDLLTKNLPIPQPEFPLYCYHMKDVNACIGTVQDADRIAQLIRHMGGSVSRDIQLNSTHLISNINYGDAYLRAVSYGNCKIVSESWVEKCWAWRNNDNFNINTDSLLCKYKIKVFCNLKFSLLGFNDDEIDLIAQQAQKEGAIVTSDVEECTHLILKSSAVLWSKSKKIPKYVVFYDWFADSLNVNGRLNERIYMANRDYSSTCDLRGTVNDRKRRCSTSSVSSLSSVKQCSPSTSSSNSNSVKRRRRSSRLSLLETDTRDERGLCKQRKPRMAEIQITEKNYLQILELLAEMKDDLGQKAGSRDQMLHLSFIDQIFKTILPLYLLHLEIYADIDRLMRQANPSPVVLSNIFVSRQDKFLAAYQPFIRCYEEIRDLIERLRKEKPQFDQYIKEFETDLRCRRLRISDLLIRPVQRIPSVILLFGAVQQYTRRHTPDYVALTDCINTLKQIAENLNSEKAKLSNWKAVLLIANCVDKCPPSLSSKCRSFIREVSLVELTDCMIGEGSSIVLFVFEDCLEFARVRPQGFFKSSIMGMRSYENRGSTALSTSSLLSANMKGHTKKKFKHLLEVKILHIKKIHLYRQYKGNKDAFGITYVDEKICRTSAPEAFEKSLIFILIEGHGVDIEEFTHEMTNLVLQQRCLTDFNSVFTEEIKSGRKRLVRSTTIVQRMKSQIHRGLSRVFSMQERRNVAKQFENKANSRKRPPPPPSISSEDSDTENVRP